MFSSFCYIDGSRRPRFRFYASGSQTTNTGLYFAKAIFLAAPCSFGAKIPTRVVSVAKRALTAPGRFHLLIALNQIRPPASTAQGAGVKTTTLQNSPCVQRDSAHAIHRTGEWESNATRVSAHRTARNSPMPNDNMVTNHHIILTFSPPLIEKKFRNLKTYSLSPLEISGLGNGCEVSPRTFLFHG